MRRFNLHAAELQRDAEDPPGYDETGYAKVGPAIGAAMLAGSLYELPPGHGVCPYHYELGDEEWLIVLEGAPTVRHPEGEETLEAGDIVCFPAGPAGAHKVMNRSAATVRVLMVSTRRMPAVAVYPDSDKIGVWSEAGREIMVRRESAVDYWDGER
jgi:uncharacterized cupin superfamily protein